MDKDYDIEDRSEETAICKECGDELPEPIVEAREGGYTELVTYCRCGAVYTD